MSNTVTPQPSRVLGRFAHALRLLEENGVSDKDWQQVIDDPTTRLSVAEAFHHPTEQKMKGRFEYALVTAIFFLGFGASISGVILHTKANDLAATLVVVCGASCALLSYFGLIIYLKVKERRQKTS